MTMLKSDPILRKHVGAGEVSAGAVALGALALGAFAVGALAIVPRNSAARNRKRASGSCARSGLRGRALNSRRVSHPPGRDVERWITATNHPRNLVLHRQTGK